MQIVAPSINSPLGVLWYVFMLVYTHSTLTRNRDLIEIELELFVLIPPFNKSSDDDRDVTEFYKEKFHIVVCENRTLNDFLSFL